MAGQGVTLILPGSLGVIVVLLSIFLHKLYHQRSMVRRLRKQGFVRSKTVFCGPDCY